MNAQLQARQRRVSWFVCVLVWWLCHFFESLENEMGRLFLALPLLLQHFNFKEHNTTA